MPKKHRTTPSTRRLRSLSALLDPTASAARRKRKPPDDERPVLRYGRPAPAEHAEPTPDGPKRLKRPLGEPWSHVTADGRRYVNGPRRPRLVSTDDGQLVVRRNVTDAALHRAGARQRLDAALARPCEVHGAAPGSPCWSVPFGLCGTRIDGVLDWAEAKR